MSRTLPLIDERGAAGRRGASLPSAAPAERQQACAAIPSKFLRKQLAPLPEVSELDAVRHFTRLSQRNFSIDGQFYPLGSCTMKYNPKINDQLANLPGFTGLHPMQPDEDCQGTLRLLCELKEHLSLILGMAGITLAPAAGAQGEYTGMAIIKDYHRRNGNGHRDEVLVP
ncbi:aminomethyl-transferring glycine dehydrogenase subunit GcvPB, partial [Candidatus Poribacteria bacterium]|nr:aminomethyl-transferring glycine dehydrogenase subunit GcvPB [Candidatus Poribacteria bacterium]